jgi:hypothetical protein
MPSNKGISTEQQREWSWNREDVDAVCGCGAVMHRHRFVHPLPRGVRPTAQNSPPPLLPPKRCADCASRIWATRERGVA